MNKSIAIKYAGSFTALNKKSNKDSKYDMNQLSIGFNFTDRYIIKVSKNKTVEWVASKVCDHASGMLEPCQESNKAKCPLHGWELDLEKLEYINVNVKKDTLNFTLEENIVSIEEYETHLKLPEELEQKQQPQDLNIRFIAHACLLFECNGINIITDPWLKGPCFLNGWWHKPAPSDDALEQLLRADVVYISHNHPDHMHEESLHYLYQHKPDVPIIVPNFKTQSAELPLKNIGFTNVIPLAFNQLYEISENRIYLSILKSGDFRDDSGLYISYGKKQALITVDSSALNNYNLPQNIDFLATSFAAGASGYPWCFDHYSESEKKQISMNRRNSLLDAADKYIKACQPRAYMPYAGYFSEDAPRDSYIKNSNKKNSPSSLGELVDNKHPTVKFTNPVKTDLVNIANEITTTSIKISRQESISPEIINQYISNESLPNTESFKQKLINYFSQSQFKDELYLYLIPCDCNFDCYDFGLIVDFSDISNIQLLDAHQVEKDYYSSDIGKRQLFIKVRANPLWQVINYMKAWEELSIGFHCRIHRKPDVYNSDFWYHFSNIYIK